VEVSCGVDESALYRHHFDGVDLAEAGEP
jgi:hypothetical protein